MRSSLGTNCRGKEPACSDAVCASEHDSAVDVRKQVRKLVVCCLALAAWAVFIFCMSANDGTASMGLSDGVTAWFARAFWPGFSDLSPADQLAFVESLSFPVRKAAHFSEYAVLGLLALATLFQARAVARSRRKRAGLGAGLGASAAAGSVASTGPTAPAVAPAAPAEASAKACGRSLALTGALAVAFAFLYACLDEFHQLFVDGRCGQPFDVAVDTSGALVAVAVALVIDRFRARRSSRKVS